MKGKKRSLTDCMASTEMLLMTCMASGKPSLLPGISTEWWDKFHSSINHSPGVKCTTHPYILISLLDTCCQQSFCGHCSGDHPFTFSVLVMHNSVLGLLSRNPPWCTWYGSPYKNGSRSGRATPTSALSSYAEQSSLSLVNLGSHYPRVTSPIPSQLSLTGYYTTSDTDHD